MQINCALIFASSITIHERTTSSHRTTLLDSHRSTRRPQESGCCSNETINSFGCKNKLYWLLFFPIKFPISKAHWLYVVPCIVNSWALEYLTQLALFMQILVIFVRYFIIHYYRPIYRRAVAMWLWHNKLTREDTPEDLFGYSYSSSHKKSQRAERKQKCDYDSPPLILKCTQQIRILFMMM